jgi:hypothetical protein
MESSGVLTREFFHSSDACLLEKGSVVDAHPFEGSETKLLN